VLELYGDVYLDLIDKIYSSRSRIEEFEISPKILLIENGIPLPDEIDVIIHTSGALGPPARVDFHWGKEVENARQRVRAARQGFRESARAALAVLHSHQMMQLKQKVSASAEAMRDLSSSPHFRRE
jgi:hypothetical protein